MSITKSLFVFALGLFTVSSASDVQFLFSTIVMHAIVQEQQGLNASQESKKYIPKDNKPGKLSPCKRVSNNIIRTFGRLR